MLSPEIHIPDIITLGVEDAIKLRTLGAERGETALEFMSGSIGVLAMWGSLAQKEGNNPNLTYGVSEGSDTFRVFSMEDLVLEAQEFYKDRITQDSILEVAIPVYIEPHLRNAVAFYQCPFNPLLSLALGFRKICLEAIEKGETFHYTVNEWETSTVIDLGEVRA